MDEKFKLKKAWVIKCQIKFNMHGC